MYPAKQQKTFVWEIFFFFVGRLCFDFPARGRESVRASNQTKRDKKKSEIEKENSFQGSSGVLPLSSLRPAPISLPPHEKRKTEEKKSKAEARGGEGGKGVLKSDVSGLSLSLSLLSFSAAAATRPPRRESRCVRVCGWKGGEEKGCMHLDTHNTSISGIRQIEIDLKRKKSPPFLLPTSLPNPKQN